MLRSMRAQGILGLVVVAVLTSACGSDIKDSAGASGAAGTGGGGSGAAGTVRRFKGEVWADNWFALYVGEAQVAEDAVPITTERSFNAETFAFEATYPFELNWVLKDYKQDDTGLEYIGTPSQQMGDGGFIMQITDTTTGKVVAASSAAFRCLVIHKGPLDATCAKDTSPQATCTSRITPEPATWKTASHDTSTWEAASVYTAAQVSPKDGYTTITWDASAQLIWTSDLKADNTLLCKLRIPGT